MLDYTNTIFNARQDASNRERRAAYKRRWSYYHGDQAKPLKVSVGQADDNVIINLARYIVDKGVAFLFGKDVGFQLEEGATTPAEETLTEIWRRNRKGTFLLKLAQLGAIYGHVFVKILPDFYGRGIARLVPIEAEYVDVSWRGDDIESAYAIPSPDGVGAAGGHPPAQSAYTNHWRWSVITASSVAAIVYPIRTIHSAGRTSGRRSLMHNSLRWRNYGLSTSKT